MGLSFSEILAKPNTNDVSDFLDTSMQLLKAKAEIYLSKLRESGQSDKKIPISRILYEDV
jgi:hypothetical protein